MNTPIIHPATEKVIRSLVVDLPQSLLITGPEGVGITAIARYVAQLVHVAPSVVLPEKDEKVDLERGVIGVDSIRKLYDQTRTKSRYDQIVIIDYAERMGHQAQNAFLKLLEEPRTGLHFILVTHTPSTLLSTIRSRAQVLEIRPITSEQTSDLLNSLKITDATQKSQLLFMANGLPAEMTRLTEDNDYFAARSLLVRDARELIQSKLYGKLLIAQKYKDDRKNSLLLLKDAANILKRSMSAKPQPSILVQIDGLLGAYQKIEAGGNIRLCLARFVLQ